MKSSIRNYVVLICTMALPWSAFSAKLPDYYPAVFDRWGVIDEINLDHQIIAVNDIDIRVARDLQVHTMTTRSATPASLKTGMMIGFGTTGTRAIKGAIEEVWILPDDYAPPHDKDGAVHDRRDGRD